MKNTSAVGGRRPPSAFRVVLLFAIGVIAAGCGDSGTEPPAISRQDVLGAYEAETFSTIENGVTSDQLALGAVLNITLHEDGTTTGRVVVPGGGVDGADFDADLTGTFSFDGRTARVTFTHAADTFLRNMVFAAFRSADVVKLSGDAVFGGTRVLVILS